MSSLKDLKLAQKNVQLQQQLVTDLQALVNDIEKCERTIGALQLDLTAANAKYPTPRTTRQDIDYLTELLNCANRKLVWEKQVASLQKRTPALLERMTGLLNDPRNPPSDQARHDILKVLQAVQAAVERLTKATGSSESAQAEPPSAADPT